MAAGIPRLLLIVAAMGLVCGLEVEEGCVPDDDTRDLELVHVVVVHRHGDRTPISRKATTYKQSPERTAFWETTVPALETVREWGELNHDETGTFLQRDPAVFPNGHLTHVGAEGMRAVGEALRRTYVTELGFLPATLPSNTSGIVRVRSTRYPRTIQSTQNLLTALYPRAARDTAGGGGAAVEITSRDKDADAMTGPSEKRCPRLAELGWKSGAGEALPPEIRAIADKTQVGAEAPHWDLFHLGEVGVCHVAHGVPPPAGLTPPEVEAVQAYVAGRWAGRMAAEPALGALAIGPFLEQLVADVDAALAAGAPRLQVYSAHDSTVLPVMVALGTAFRGWPPYSARVELQLLRDRAAGEVFLRLKYQGERYNVLEGAAGALEGRPVLHRWREVRAAVRAHVPADWGAACAASAPPAA